MFRCALTIIAIAAATTTYAGYYVKRPPPALVKNPYGGTFKGQYGTGAYFLYGGSYGAWDDNVQNKASIHYWGQGEIVTVYDWKADFLPGTQIPDPSDLPPQKVILEEESAARFSSHAYDNPVISGNLVVPGVGVCDNGLGDDPVYFSLFDTRNGESKGVRYSVVNGGPEITVRCSPSVDVTLEYGRASAGIGYKSRIISPSITWKGITKTVDGKFFITGQQITAEVQLLSSGNGEPVTVVDDGIGITNREWGLPTQGLPFKQYTYGSTGQVLGFSKADIIAEKI